MLLINIDSHKKTSKCHTIFTSSEGNSSNKTCGNSGIFMMISFMNEKRSKIQTSHFTKQNNRID